MNINMVNDIFLIAEKQFLKQYGYMNAEVFKKEKNEILDDLFSKEEIIEYNEFLKNDDVAESQFIPTINKYAVCVYFYPQYHYKNDDGADSENFESIHFEKLEDAKKRFKRCKQVYKCKRGFKKSRYYVELWDIPKDQLIGNNGSPILKSDFNY